MTRSLGGGGRSSAGGSSGVGGGWFWGREGVAPMMALEGQSPLFCEQWRHLTPLSLNFLICDLKTMKASLKGWRGGGGAWLSTEQWLRLS